MFDFFLMKDSLTILTKNIFFYLPVNAEKI